MMGLRGRFAMRDARAGQGLPRERRLLALLRRPDIQRMLGLTEEQRNKLEDIRSSSAKVAIQQRANLQIQRLDLERLMRAENPDRAAIDGKLQELAQTRAALTRAAVFATLDARGVLTKEQRQKLAEQMQQAIRPGAPPPVAEPGPKPAAKPKGVKERSLPTPVPPRPVNQ